MKIVMNDNPIITVPINVGAVTLVGYIIKKYPSKIGNCFSLIDLDGKSHRVVNFNFENLQEWINRTGQKDIKVRLIPKSETLWEISDDRIPNEWYNEKYCTVCTPLRMLPFEQRKEELSKYSFKKYKTEDGYAIMRSLPIKANAKKLETNWTVEISQDLESYYGKEVEEKL